MIGPSYTLAETGNFLQATTSLSRSIAANNVKSNLIQEVKSDNYCETFHTSELNQILLEQKLCYMGPCRQEKKILLLRLLVLQEI